MAGTAGARRRIITVPVVVILALVLWILAPLWFVLAGTVDVVRWVLARRPFVGVRLVAMGLVYTAGEIIGLTACVIGWIRCRFSSTDRCLERNAFGIQLWWAEFLFQSMSSLLGLTYSVEGEEVTADGPYVILVRHASIIDTLLPAHFISRPYHRHIRYVLKDELLVDPALDVAGNRLPNVFVRRGSGDASAEADRIRTLAATMPDDEAIVIFPEGTRFAADKRTRILERLGATDPELQARAARLQHVLPPRSTGTIAILEGTDADVIVFAHRGLEGLARLADIWRGDPVGRSVDIRFTRVPRGEIPESSSGRAAWLADTWEDLDRWVGDGNGNGS